MKDLFLLYVNFIVLLNIKVRHTQILQLKVGQNFSNEITKATFKKKERFGPNSEFQSQYILE